MGVLHLLVKLLPLILVVGAIVAAVWGVRAALFSDTSFMIQKIDVRPAHELAPEKRQSLETRYLGKNLLRVDIQRIARDLEMDPEIKYANVIRRFPSTLEVDIKRRKSVAYIQFAPRSDYGLISDDGMILDVTSKPNPSAVLVEAFSMGVSKPGIGMQVKGQGYLELVRFLNAFWASPIAQNYSVLTAALDHLGNVSVTMSNGLVIRLGRNPYGRLEALGKIIPLLEDEDRSKIEYVDVQFDDVIVKRKGGK